MEIKDDNSKARTLLHGDVRVPEVSHEDLKGPSRARVMLHLTGIGLGFLLLLVGAGLGISTGTWDKLALIPVIVGGSLVAGWITVNYSFLAKVVRNRRVMVGTNAVFMGVLAIVLLTLVNFISYRHYAKWDFTEEKVFTLSPKTESILKALDKDVTVIVFHLGKARTGMEEVLVRLTDLLKLYTQSSRRVTVVDTQVDVDPESTKVILQKYNIDTTIGLMADDVYVICGDKRKVLRLNDMADWEYQGNPMNPRQRLAAFKGEQSVTSAILEVTSARQPKIYVLSGHGEKSVSDMSELGLSDFAGALKRDYYSLETLAVIPDTGVPADCDLLMVMAPQAALASKEVDAVRQYLDRGGRLFYCEDVRQNSGLDGLMSDWGVTVGNDIVISLDSRTVSGNVAFVIAVNFGAHDISTPLQNFAMALNVARTVSPSKAETGRAQVTSLIGTTPNSFADTDLESIFKGNPPSYDPAKDTKGPVSMAAAVEERKPRAPEGVEVEDNRKLARIVVVGDSDAFANYVQKLGFRNIDFGRNAVNWLVERKELIAIDARPEIPHILAIDAAGVKAIFWLVIVALPFVVLLTGGMVWAIRSYGSRSA